jgi:HK97 family phage major capsid protein
MNIESLIARYTGERDSARTRYDRARQEITDILDRAKAAGHSNLSAEADQRCEILLEKADKAKAELRDAESALAKAEAIKAEDDEYMRTSSVSIPTNAGMQARGRGQTAVMHVGNEPHTYRAQHERTRTNSGEPETSFLQDLYRAQILNDPSSMQRLQRHGDEMSVDNPKLVQRAVGTGGVPGFIPPAYLAEDFALFARAGRPLANLCNNQPLPPEGMSVNIPRVTTSTLTGVQASENTTVANQDPAATLLTTPVVSIAGYIITSRQALERGTMVEQVIVGDLAADYGKQLDLQLINGSGSAGQHLGLLNIAGINAVTYTTATPVLSGATTPMWPKLASCIGLVLSGRFAGPSGIVMSPTEWAWMLAAVDSNNRPLVQPNDGAYNPLGLQMGADYRNPIAGYLMTVPVVLDGNIPANLGAGTNETRIIVADFNDCYLFENSDGSPSQLRFEQPQGSALGIMLIAYGYSAFSGGRQPKSISVMQGTGLITPAL